MIRPPTIVRAVALCLCLLVSSCASRNQHSTTGPLSFDTSYSAPIYWKVVEEGLWGIRFNIPPTLEHKKTESTHLWIHEGANLRVIVDFGSTSPDSFRQKPNYSETRLQVNGLPALVCSYDRTNNAAAGSLNKVVALFFLDKRKELGGQEPSYRVEYASDDDRTTALQILQTVHFYDS
jgi:hypothetical protein